MIKSDQVLQQAHRKIVHIDMDCFFAAVEMRDTPAYRDIPLAISGRSQQRGVLSTCNYLARKYGLHSAMPVFQAKQRCPELLIIPGRMEVYQQVSMQLRSIFHRYTELVEPLSLDEAYLDVTDSCHFQGSATLIARDIRQAINDELQLTASAGISYCKFLAKIASDENKPNGQCVITPQYAPDYIQQLPLKKIPGVGKVAQQRLAEKQLVTCGDVFNYPETQLIDEFGKLGHILLAYSKGVDLRPVEPNRERKSVAVERTFSANLYSEAQCLIKLKEFYFKLEQRIAKHYAKRRIIKLGVKLKFSDFTVKSSERQYFQLNLEIFEQLLRHLLVTEQGKPIRLLGVSASFSTAEEDTPLQLSLLD